MKKVAILGSANALKPLIILQNIIESSLINDIDIVYFTESPHGICVDYCNEKKIKTLVFHNPKLDDKNSIIYKSSENPDCLISAGWPFKIPGLFLNSFPFPPINCHGSLLPDYRGSRAYMHYWANCEEYYGATIHYMNEKFDDGNILIQGRLKAFSEETPEIMHRRTAELCAHLLPAALHLVKNRFEGIPGKGIRRYFFRLKPGEFEEYREFNRTKESSERRLTPHKYIN